MSHLMKALIFNGENVYIKQVKIPKPAENQVLIRIKYAGICGTDLSIIKGELKVPVPLILGHEITGEIVGIGKACETDWLGKNVTSEINMNICGECYYCKMGMKTQCINRKTIGISINGGWAEYIAVDVDNVFELPKEISLEEGVFIEPLASVYRIFETMPLNVDIDKNIAIFGMGKLGLLLLQVSKKKGIKTIAISGSNHKLKLAKKLGANNIINYTRNNVPETIKNLTKGIGADIVVDVTGNALAINDIINSCRKRGKIHIKSTLGNTSINLRDLVVNEKTIYTSRCGSFETAIDGISRKDIEVKPLISKEYKLEEINLALNDIKNNSNIIKVILKC